MSTAVWVKTPVHAQDQPVAYAGQRYCGLQILLAPDQESVRTTATYTDNVGSVTEAPVYGGESPTTKDEKNWNAKGAYYVKGKGIPSHNDVPLQQTYFTTNQGYLNGRTLESKDMELKDGLGSWKNRRTRRHPARRWARRGRSSAALTSRRRARREAYSRIV